MNICFFTTEFPNLRSGGIENVTFRLAQEFIRRGHNVFCISLNADVNCSDVPFKYMTIDKTNNSNSIIIRDFIRTNNIKICINQAIENTFLEIIKCIKSQLPDVKFVKVHHTDPMSFSKGVIDNEPLYTHKRPYLRFLYTSSPLYLLRLYRRNNYARDLFRDWIKLYDQIVVLSKEYISDLKKVAQTTSCNNVIAIGNPSSFEDYKCSLPKENIVLYVGRLNRQAKRPDRLLAIWKKIYDYSTDWQLVIIGDGPLKPELEYYCKIHGLKNVSFCGQINPREYYKRASIICITSTYEGVPVVCSEAFSAEVVPIAFNSFSAIKDLIKDGYNGLLVKPYSLKKYAEKLKMLMRHSGYRDRLRENIQNDTAFERNFSMDVIVGEWEKLFEQLII